MIELSTWNCCSSSWFHEISTCVIGFVDKPIFTENQERGQTAAYQEKNLKTKGLQTKDVL